MDITQCSSFETGLQVVGHQNSCHFHHLPSFPLPPSSKKNSKLDKAKKNHIKFGQGKPIERKEPQEKNHHVAVSLVQEGTRKVTKREIQTPTQSQRSKEGNVSGTELREQVSQRGWRIPGGQGPLIN